VLIQRQIRDQTLEALVLVAETRSSFSPLIPINPNVRFH
jgi:hypothetical protein